LLDDGDVAHHLRLITIPLLDSAELVAVLGFRGHAMAAVLSGIGGGGTLYENTPA